MIDFFRVKAAALRREVPPVAHAQSEKRQPVGREGAWPEFHHVPAEAARSDEGGGVRVGQKLGLPPMGETGERNAQPVAQGLHLVDAGVHE